MALPKKILIISAAWIGDMVISQALFKYIKQQYAETIIDIILQLNEKTPGNSPFFTAITI